MPEYDLYVAHCSHGKVRAVMVNNPDRRAFMAQEIGEWIMDGLVVQRIEDSPPKELWKCAECDARKEKIK